MRIRALLAVMVAVWAWTASAQRPAGVPEDPKRVQAEFLAQIDHLDQGGILLIFSTQLDIGAVLSGTSSHPRRTLLRVCDAASPIIANAELQAADLTREELQQASRRWLRPLFKVPLQFLDAQPCRLEGQSGADIVMARVDQVSAFVRQLAKANELINPRTGQLRFGYRPVSRTAEGFITEMSREAQVLRADRRRELERSFEEGTRKELDRLEKAARAGDAESALRGEQLAEASGNSKRQASFRRLRAELSRSADLKFEVGQNLLEGRGDYPRDIIGGRKLLEEAAKLGHGYAMLALAANASQPNGTGKENSEALQLLEAATQMGIAEAAGRLNELKRQISRNQRAQIETSLLSAIPWVIGFAVALAVIGVIWTQMANIGLWFRQFTNVQIGYATIALAAGFVAIGVFWGIGGSGSFAKECRNTWMERSGKFYPSVGVSPRFREVGSGRSGNGKYTDYVVELKTDNFGGAARVNLECFGHSDGSFAYLQYPMQIAGYGPIWLGPGGRSLEGPVPLR